MQKSVGVSVSLESVPAYSHWECSAWGGNPQQHLVEYPWPRSRKSAKWYGQEKKKLWVHIAICFVSLPPFVSHTTEASTPFVNKVWELYFYKEVLWFLLLSLCIIFIGWLIGLLVNCFLWYINPCMLFNVKSCLYIHLYIYIYTYMICEGIVCQQHYFQMKQSSFFCTHFNG